MNEPTTIQEPEIGPVSSSPVPEQDAGETETHPTPDDDARKFLFILNFRGREKRLELTHAQVTSRLQILESYKENEAEFWAGVKELEPLRHIVRSHEFRVFLEEQEQAHPERMKPIPQDLNEWTTEEKKLRKAFRDDPSAGSAAKLILWRQRKPITRRATW